MLERHRVKTMYQSRTQCRKLYLGFFILVCWFQSTAMAYDIIAIPPGQPVIPGGEVEVTILIQNTDTHPVSLQTVPAEISASISDEQTELSVNLYRQTSVTGIELETNTTYSLIYTLTIPAELSAGPVSLQLHDDAIPPIYLLASVPVSDQDSNEPVASSIRFVSNDEDKDDELVRNDFLGNISAYQPTYFAVGVDPRDAKIQLSFKYQFINENSQVAVDRPWLTGFFFAYTQLSLWDLESDSIPFEDTNFLPELFYQFNDVDLPFFNGATRADLQIGIQHESNGRDADDSRSLNIAYLEPAVHFDLDDGYQLSIVPRIWSYFGGQDGNEDIEDFRGYASLTATLGKRDGFQIEAYLRGNPGTGNGAMQLDFTYPLNKLTFASLDFYLHAQLFRGFGESLLDFNQRDTRFRIGLGIVR